MARQPWSNTLILVFGAFCVASLLIGVGYRHRDALSFVTKKKYKFPDFNRIIHTRTLSEDEIALGDDERIIVIGDMHGMNRSLHELLDEVDYSPQSDILMFAGDMLAKSTTEGSLAILDYLAENRQCSSKQPCGGRKERIFGVRGNHDQFVVQWRAWREWFEQQTIPGTKNTISTGRQFLKIIEGDWLNDRKRKDMDAEEWVEVARKRASGTWKADWWARIPKPGQGKHEKEWKMFEDHYWLAKDMSTEQATFLKSLPLILHMPAMHAYVVHAGILPSNPRLEPTDLRQPLTHLPAVRDSQDQSKVSEDTLRALQEQTVLDEIPQNQDPWVVLNMRGVLNSGKVTRDNEEGTPWSDIWNDQMRRCSGFSSSTSSFFKKPKEKHYSLICHPSTVIYGHAASRGLDIKRWSMGVDTGCLYGRKLSALVLSRQNGYNRDVDLESNPDLKHIKRGFKFGDPRSGIRAHITSVRCPDMDD